MKLIARLLTFVLLLRGLSTTKAPAESPIPPQRSDEPGPDTPLDLEGHDWKVSVKRAIKEIKQDRIPFIAAGMAYYFFLAIFPALIALIGVLGIAQVDASGLVDSVRASLHGGAGEALTQAIARADRPSESASLVAAVAGIAVALWSASSGFVALQSGLNVAYDVEQDRKFVGARAHALLLLLATIGLGGVPSPIFTFGESSVFTVLGWVVTVIAVMVLFSLYFYIGPNRPKPSWHWVSVGGIVGALLWIASSSVFGFYVNTFNSYDKTYGPLGGVIVLILWLYLSSLAVLIGGELNAELERQASGEDA